MSSIGIYYYFEKEGKGRRRKCPKKAKTPKFPNVLNTKQKNNQKS